MPLNIGELLGSYSTGMRALLQAAGLPESMMGDAASGGTPAPAASPAASTPATRPPVDPRLAFLQNAQKGPRSLVEALAQGHQFKPQGYTVPSTPVRLLTDAAGKSPLERTIRVNAGTGPRANEAFQAFDLGGGRQAHVYVDEKGRRQVVTLRRR
jgi:hypothetical protein